LLIKYGKYRAVRELCVLGSREPISRVCLTYELNDKYTIKSFIKITKSQSRKSTQAEIVEWATDGDHSLQRQNSSGIKAPMAMKTGSRIEESSIEYGFG